MEPDNEIQSKDRRDLGDLHDGCRVSLARFDATERRARQVRGRCDLFLAQPRGESLPLQLVCDGLEEPLAVP